MNTEIAQLWNAGVPSPVIGKKFGISSVAVRDRAARMGLSRRRQQQQTCPIVLASVRRLWWEGQSASQIGAALGKTRNAVIGLVHRRKFAKNPELRMHAPQPREKREPRVREPKPERARATGKASKPMRTRVPDLALPRVFQAIDDVPAPEWVGTPFNELRDNVELAPRFCRFIATSVITHDVPCCGARTDGRPWCAEHMKVAFEPRRKRGVFVQPRWGR